MKKLFLILIFLFPYSLLHAQNTVVTATITDSDGQVWSGAKWTAVFVPNSRFTNIKDYKINNVPLNPALLQQQGFLDVNGVFVATFYDNSQITPSGSAWNFTICPNVSVQCSAINNVTLQSPTMNLSSFLSSAITTPRFAALGSNSFGYNDTEISPTPEPGGSYFNVINAAIRIWSGSTWTNLTQGGGNTLPVGTIINGLNITFPASVTATTFTSPGSGAGSIKFANGNSNYATIGPLSSVLVPWTLDTTSPATTLASIGSAGTVASGVAVLGITPISSGSCTSAITVTATGVLTTDVITVGFNTDPTAIIGYSPLITGMLTIIPYPSSGNVNFKTCNMTTSSITPGAITLNWKVVR